jgi:hypothetical protein
VAQPNLAENQPDPSGTVLAKGWFMLKHVLVLGSAFALFACGGESSSDGAGGASSGGTSSGGTSSGGTSSGGTSSGGTSSGGTSAGGTSSGGTGNVGGTSTAGVIGECKVDADCELQKSCCECLAGKAGSVTLGPCDAALCTSSLCDELGVTEARCIAGQCTIAANCNIDTATCKSLPPKCPAGTTATVNATGCWGPCLPHQACAEVEDCFVCPAGNICVVNDAWGSSHHCVNPSPNCGGGCACLEPLVCINGYTLCNEFDDGSAAHCECPNC